LSFHKSFQTLGEIEMSVCGGLKLLMRLKTEWEEKLPLEGVHRNLDFREGRILILRIFVTLD
jgi:hypothetical protein